MGNENTTSSYLDPPQLHGVLNKDGTYTLSALEMKKQSDFNYYVAKMIQGGLNLANLNKETKEVFTNIEGDVTELGITAQGLTLDISNVSGEVSSISATVNGLSVADETGSYTIIDGDKIVSKDHATGGIVEIKDGNLSFKNGTTLLGEITPDSLGMYLAAGTGKWIYLDGNVQVGLYDPVGVNGSTIVIQSGTTLKLVAGTNMAIDSSGTIYIGTSAGQSGNVSIGKVGGRVDLNGDIYKNGVLL